MKKEEFYFDSRDGSSKIHAVRYLPEGKPVCILQIVHGMAEYVERYEEFADFLTQRGVLVTGEDHLGHGLSLGEDKLYGYFCPHDPATVVVRDVHRLKKLTQQRFPDLPCYIMGHSMGSFILRCYLGRYGTGIDGAVIMGTGRQSGALLAAARAFLKLQGLFLGEKHVSPFVDRVIFGGYNKRIPDPQTSFDWLSRDGERVRRYVEDPKCGNVFTVNGFQTLLELIRRSQDGEYISRIPKDLPLLLIAGKEDPLGEYGAGVPAVGELYCRAGLKKVEVSMWDGCRHELLNEPEREKIMMAIYEWLRRQLAEKGR